jgi:hypothetical protein
MSITLSALQKQRRDTAANWTTQNPTLLAGELGYESDTGYWKVGDGTTAWASLGYISGLGAEIPVNRLADGSARQLLQTAANGSDVEWTSNVDVPGTLDVTGAATFDSAVTVQGDLTVNGTTTTIDTQNLVIEDAEITIGKVATPTDTTANTGGVRLKGTTDKLIQWFDATDAWTFSEHVDLASGKGYYINGTQVLSSSALGSGVTGSSLTSVGTLTSGTWSASTIAVNKGGTGQTSYTDGQLLIGNSTGNTLSKATLTAGTAITVTNGSGSVTVAAQLTDSTSSTSTTTAATPNSVKTAYDLANNALPKAGGTLTGDVTLNAQSDLRFADADSSNWVAFQAPSVVASNVTWTLPSADGTSSQVLSTNGSGTLSWATPASGTVTSVTGTSPIVVATGTTTPAISIQAATTSQSGAVQLTDSTSSTSTTTAATPNSVKTAYDLANAALPKAGGTLTGNVDNSATGYFDLPSGTTAQRPGTANSGMIRYNSDIGKFEGYTTTWGSIGGGATGSGGDDVFYENGQTVTTNYTLTAGKNAMSAGPITINSGVTVTVGSGQSWVIV